MWIALLLLFHAHLLASCWLENWSGIFQMLGTTDGSILFLKIARMLLVATQNGQILCVWMLFMWDVLRKRTTLRSCSILSFCTDTGCFFSRICIPSLSHSHNLSDLAYFLLQQLLVRRCIAELLSLAIEHQLGKGLSQLLPRWGLIRSRCKMVLNGAALADETLQVVNYL